MNDLSLDRQWAETTLNDTCTVYREATTEPVWNDSLGRNEYPDDQQVYFGPCSVSYGVSERRIEEGSDPLVLGEWTIRVPIEVVDVTSGDVVVVDSIHAGGDPALVAKAFTVRRVGARSQAVLRRLFCDVREPTSL